MSRKNVTKAILTLLLTALVTAALFGSPGSAVSQADPTDPTIYLPVVSSGGSTNDWATVAGNPQRTSHTKNEVRGSLRPEWYKKFDAYIAQRTQIIAAANKLFISTSAGLYALDAGTGNQLWFYPTSLPLGHSPTYSQGSVYVGGFDKKIHALNAETGQKQWEFTAGAGFETNPLVVNGLVMAGSRDGFFYALYASGPNAGRLAWKYQTAGPILLSAAYANNTVFFASTDMYAYALRASDGALVWKSGSKLPGNKLRSWWPVIYRDYVIFSGSYNYRVVRPYGGYMHTTMSIEGVYPPGLSDGDLLSAPGTVSGDWAAGTRTLNASRISSYYETYPYRRTVVILSQASGQEYTYDSNGNGKPEYAPIQFVGAKTATRYPPAVGPDNVLYQSNHYIFGRYIPRGHISGWKFGTSTISIPAPDSSASDEPMGYSIGGSTVYYKLCCDRTAGAFGLADRYSTYYFGYGGELRRTFPELYSGGWSFAYWKHGDTSPPIPYGERVYTINNNAVIAFSANGKSPVITNEDLGRDTGEDAGAIERAVIAYGLNTKVTLDNTRWPLLYQQERYFEIRSNIDPPTRARHFRIFQVAGTDASAPSSLARADTNITTALTSTSGGSQLITRVSRRTPTILFNNTAATYRLTGSFAGMAYSDSGGVRVQTSAGTISGTALAADWLLVWDSTANHRWMPVVISLQNRPSSIAFSPGGITLSYGGAAGYLGATPLYGMSAPLSSEASTWPGGIPNATIARAQVINRMARYFPVSSTDTFSVDAASGNVTQTYATNPGDLITYSGFATAAPAALGFIPPHLALAAWNNSPIRINNQPLASHAVPVYLTPVGQVAWVEGSSTVTAMYPGLANYWRSPLPAPPQAASNDPVRVKLEEEVQKIVNAGHLKPGYGMHGLWDGYSGSLGINLPDYWENPAETYFTLIRALPFLSSGLQTQTRAYIASEFQTFPAYTYCHVGWNSGVSRQAFDLPPEVINDSVNSPPETCSGEDFGFPQENLYASWLYAKEFPAIAGSVYNNSTPKLIANHTYPNSLSYVLNSHIAGHFGILKLGQLASPGLNQADRERNLTDMLVLRAAVSKYPMALQQTGFEYAGLQWGMRSIAGNMPDTLFVARIQGTLWSQYKLYGFPLSPLYGLSGGFTGGGYAFGIDFVNLVPEAANFMHDYVPAETLAAVNDYNLRAPYWFVAEAAEGAGENTIVPIYDTVALFSAKALVLKQDRGQLEPYLDAPSVPVGDLSYIQKLILTLSGGS